MNILEALQWGENQIRVTTSEKSTNGHNAKLDAQLLLASILKKPSSFLFAHFDQALNPLQQKNFKSIIERRAQHEPVAYILGHKDFYKRRFNVNPHVLIPRPATESLVELAIKLSRPESTIIDLGTGSGAIAITIAVELEQSVVAIEIDEKALMVAKENAKIHKVNQTISFLLGDLLSPYLEKNITETGHTLILANLPYLPTGFVQIMDPDVTKYEPNKALYAGINGLDLYDALLRQIKGNRSKFNKIDLLMEIDSSQELSLPHLVKRHFPDANVTVHDDLSGLSRIVQVQL